LTVKIIPISPDYRANFDGIFGTTPCASAERLIDKTGSKFTASEIQGVINSIPPTPLIAPDGTGSASSAPRGATILDCFPDRVFMTSPLPASWGMVDGRPF
jgi:hypothetical protein